MDNVSHLRPDCQSQLGLFYAGNILRQSDPLALTQLIILYHVVNKMHEAVSEEAL
jgi:phosphoribulokinase